MFLGRRYELSQLQYLYGLRNFQLFILYGRRRVGKTSLLKEFCRDKNHIFFSAELSSNKYNLEKFSQIVFTHYGDSRIEPFVSWNSALHYINDRQKNSRLVLVIDEFPYMAQSEAALLSNFQHMIDHELQNGNLFIILCGSYMAFMEKEVFSSKNPLFGRRTGQLQLKPFDYFESSLFMEGFTNEEKLMFYGALGGTPIYLRQINPNQSFKENIINAFLHSTSYLYEEPMFLLREELQQPATYNVIIEAIAGGASKASEISSKADEESSKCLKYIKVLRNLGILYKEIPFGEKESSRRTIYGINDFMFRFWYRYIFNNKTLIETDAQEIVWQYKIEPDYSTYMWLVFEKVCKEFLLRLNNKGKLPFIFTNIGHWWGNDPQNKQQAEVDIIANDRNDYIFCECKWRNSLADIDVLMKLQHRSDLILGHKDKGIVYFALFSKTGFTDEIKNEAAKKNNILLFDVNDLFHVGDQ